MTNDLVLIRHAEPVPTCSPELSKSISPAGLAVLRWTVNAELAADELFSAAIANDHTRRAYGRIVGKFLSWCHENEVALHQITPGHAGRYMRLIKGSPQNANQTLAALRKFYDFLVQRHAVALNSFASVRGVKHSTTEGKTAELGIEQARGLFRSIDVSKPVGLRDRAVLGVLAYTGARVGAVAKLRLSDYRDTGENLTLRFDEKNGKQKEIPVRDDLKLWLSEYLDAASKVEVPPDEAERLKDPPLFRAVDKQKALTNAAYGAHSMRQMMKRRLRDAGLSDVFSPHSFRVTVVTDLLNQNVPLEDVQYLAGHSSPTTTRIYDRRRRRVTRNIVERISI